MALRRGFTGIAGSAAKAWRHQYTAAPVASRLQPFTTFPNNTRREDEQDAFSGKRGFSTDLQVSRKAGLIAALEKMGNFPDAAPPSSPAIEMAVKNPTAAIMYDEAVHPRYPVSKTGAANHKAFTYMVLTGGRFVYASIGRAIVLKFILSMTATADVLALASLEVDISAIDVGNTVTVKWRGKPVFIRRRSDSDVAMANDCNISELRDPQTDNERVVNPEWLVVLGVCTHLGCVPLSNAGDYGGWFCPCHGSHYDISGRIRRGPAPYNLEVPEYSFTDDTHLLVG